MRETEAAQRDVEVGAGVEPVLDDGGFDARGAVDGLQGWEVGVGDSEGVDLRGDVGFEVVPCFEGLGEGAEGGVED